MDSDAATVILIPVLRRPHRVAPLLDSISFATPEPHRVLFICTAGDTAQLQEVEQSGADHLVIQRHGPGDYARKINHGYANSTEPLIFLGADDLAFRPGWLTAAKVHLSDSIHVVGTNDLGNKKVMEGTHATHSLLTRFYADTYGTIDEPHKILHEGYPHTFVDDEFVQTAISRRMFAHAPDSIVEHLHPHWGKGVKDGVYNIADRSVHPGRRIFNRRKHLWLHPAR